MTMPSTDNQAREALIEQIEALLAMNKTGQVSHRVPGLAVDLLTKAIATLRQHDEAGAVRVRVKPLEWTRNLHGITQWAETPFGTYVIDPTRAKPIRFMWSGVVGEWMTVDTEDEAKAAAQADYERRILAALEAPEPVTQRNFGTRELMWEQHAEAHGNGKIGSD